MPSVRTKGKRVNLHFTLVGQGAFNNPQSVLKNALEAVYDTVSYFDVDVFIHGFDDSAVKKIQDSLPIHADLMDETTFLSQV